MEYRQPSLLEDGNCTRTIPLDLFVEVLSLLPPKSLVRFQTVSKLWFSTIRSKTLADLFLARSKSRPHLLLSLWCYGSKECFIFSAPEHDNNDNEKSSTVMAKYQMTNLEPGYCLASGPVNGFVCLVRYVLLPSVCSPIIVYNPTTRQIVKLPEAVTSNTIRNMYARLGYDPVDDQYKVLCVVMARSNCQPEHFVCTVSSFEKQEWRKIENTTGCNYHSVYGETHIDGAIYYGAGKSGIIKFNVRSEKIEFIKTPQETHNISRPHHHPTLINYKGKLAGVDYHCKENSMTLWVLEDAEKQEWSSMTCDLPSTLKDLLGFHIRFKGVSHTGKLMVFYPGLMPSKPPFYVCYYDFDKKSIRKVEIQGMVDGNFRLVHGIGRRTDMWWILYFTGHIENIRFL